MPDSTPTRARLTDPWPPRLWQLGAALVVVLVIAVYWPTLSGAYLWDDNAHVPRHELRSLHGLWRIGSELGATQQYYPLLFSWFWAQCRLWGDWTPGYHAVTIALHSGAALLVMAVVRRLLRSRGHAWADLAAWATGAVWALHPVNVESVAWITQQKNTLSAVLYLASMLVYLRFDESRRPRLYACATALFFLSLISKPVTVTLPPALLVIFWWRRGRLSPARDVVPLLPWFALSLASGALAAYVEHSVTGAKGDEFGLAPAERLLLPGRVVLFYLAKVLWPAELLFMYPRWSVSAAAWNQWLYPAGVLALLAAAWAVRARWRAPLAGLLFFAGSLFPVLGLFNVYLYRYTFVADHFQYLPCLGVIVVVCGAAALFASRARSAGVERALVAAFVGVPLVLGVLSFRQCRIYSDVETLYKATLLRNPTAWMMHNNLGIMLGEQGRHEEARENFRRAIALNPANPELFNNLGVDLFASGDRFEAISQFREALRMRPEYPEALDNLVNALIETGRATEAVGWAMRAVSLDARNPRFQLGLALALGAGGRHAEALSPFSEAARLDPDLAEAHWGVAVTLDKLGRRDEAVAAAQRTLSVARRNQQPDIAAAAEAWLATRGPR